MIPLVLLLVAWFGYVQVLMVGSVVVIVKCSTYF